MRSGGRIGILVVCVVAQWLAPLTAPADAATTAVIGFERALPATSADPEIASNGNGYLVVAGETAVRLSRIGAVLDPNGIVMAPGFSALDIAWNGSAYLVVSENGSRLVRSDGVVVAPPVAFDGESVASNGSNALVADVVDGSSVIGRLVDQSGAVLQTLALLDGTSPSTYSEPEVAWTGSSYVVYATRRNPAPCGFVLSGVTRSFDATGAPLGPVQVVHDPGCAGPPPPSTYFAFHWAAGGSTVAWECQVQEPGGVRTTICGADVPDSLNTQIKPAVAADGTHLWWNEGDGITDGATRVDGWNPAVAAGAGSDYAIAYSDADFHVFARVAGATPQLAIDDVQVAEGPSGTTTTAAFTASLSAPFTAPVTFNFATAVVKGGATAGVDFVATSGPVTIGPGATTATVPITINGDGAVEGDERFLVNISSVTNATLVDGQGNGTILNDDAAAVPGLSIGDAQVAEGPAGTTTTAAFTVSLTAPSSSPVTFSFATATVKRFGATPGVDFVATSGTATLAPGQTTATVPVTINGDGQFEPDESFTLNITAVSGATLGDARGTGTIRNDDVSTGP